MLLRCRSGCTGAWPVGGLPRWLLEGRWSLGSTLLLAEELAFSSEARSAAWAGALAAACAAGSCMPCSAIALLAGMPLLLLPVLRLLELCSYALLEFARWLVLLRPLLLNDPSASVAVLLSPPCALRELLQRLKLARGTLVGCWGTLLERCGCASCGAGAGHTARPSSPLSPPDDPGTSESSSSLGAAVGAPANMSPSCTALPCSWLTDQPNAAAMIPRVVGGCQGPRLLSLDMPPPPPLLTLPSLSLPLPLRWDLPRLLPR